MIYAKEGLHTTATINKKIKTNYLSFASNDVTIGERPAKRFLVKQILAHLPLFLHPKPDSVLLIGFGEGEIARKILLHQIKYFDCIEKSPCLVQAASIFNNSKKILSGDPDFHLITMNENTYVKVTDKKYNVIISNCFHPAFVGINRFFSKDFFQSCKNILTSPGILAIPVPMYSLSIEDFKILLRTFYEIFPSTSVWYNNNSFNQHVMLVGRKNLLNEINVNQLQLRINKKAIKNDLHSTGLETIYEALDCFLMGPSELNKLTMGVRINSKNNPVLEFSTPQVTNNPKTINHILQLLKSYREPMYPYIAYIDSSIKKRDDLLRILDNYFKSSDKVLDAISSQLLGRTNQTLTFYQQAYMLNRDDRAAKLFLDNYYNPYLSPSPKSPFEFTENAKIYFQKTEYETAIASLEHAINLDKNYSPAFFALGLNYEMLGDFKIAKQMYQQTLQLQPGLENVQNRLKVVEEMLENMKF